VSAGRWVRKLVCNSPVAQQLTGTVIETKVTFSAWREYYSLFLRWPGFQEVSTVLFSAAAFGQDFSDGA